MLVVVQTYPAHFYQTLVCLRSIHDHVKSLKDLLLVLDDRSPLCWKSYIDDCRREYSGLFTNIIKTSDIPGLRFLGRYPWLRQQTTKLVLDTVVNGPEWLFIDGDVELTSLPPVDSVPGARRKFVGVSLDQRDPQPGEMSSQVLFYISHMLGIDFRGFWDPDDNTTMITASNPPVHTMRADILQNLRSYIEKRFGSNIYLVHKNLAQDTRMAASEWDLIECFRQTMMGEPANWYLDPEFYQTTWSSDKELGQEWFLDRNIDLDHRIWCVLPDLKYF